MLVPFWNTPKILNRKWYIVPRWAQPFLHCKLRLKRCCTSLADVDALWGEEAVKVVVEAWGFCCLHFFPLGTGRHWCTVSCGNRTPSGKKPNNHRWSMWAPGGHGSSLWEPCGHWCFMGTWLPGTKGLTRLLLHPLSSLCESGGYRCILWVCGFSCLIVLMDRALRWL